MAEISNSKASSTPGRIAWEHNNKPSSGTKQKEESTEQFDSFSKMPSGLKINLNPESSILRLPNIQTLKAESEFSPDCSFDTNTSTNKSIEENINSMRALVEGMDDNDRASLIEDFTRKGVSNLSLNEAILAKEILRYRLLKFRQRGYNLGTLQGPGFNTVFFDKRKDDFLLNTQLFARDKKIELPIHVIPKRENPLFLPKSDPISLLTSYETRIDLTPAYNIKSKEILKSINIHENNPNYEILHSNLVKHLEYQRSLILFDNGQLDRTKIPQDIIESNPELKEIFNEHAAYFALAEQFNSVSERLHKLGEAYREKNLYADSKWYSQGIENTPFGLLQTLFLQEISKKDLKRVSPEDKFRTLVLIEKFKEQNPEMFADGNGILSFIHSYNEKSDDSVESSPYNDSLHRRIKKEPTFNKYSNETLVNPINYLKGDSKDSRVQYESLTEDEKEIIDTHQTRYNIKLLETRTRRSLVEQCDECFNLVNKKTNETLNGEGFLDTITDSLRRLTYRDATSTDISNKLKEVHEAKSKLDELKYSLSITKDGTKIDTVENFTKEYNERVKDLISKLQELQEMLGEHEEARQLWNEVITDICGSLAACIIAPMTGGGSLVVYGTAFAVGGVTKVTMKSLNDATSSRGLNSSKSYARDFVTGGMSGVTCLAGARIEQIAAKALMKKTGWSVGESILSSTGAKYLAGRIPVSMASGAAMGFSISTATEGYDSLTIPNYNPSFEEIMGNGYRAAGLGAILNPVLQGTSYSLRRAFTYKPPKLDPNLPELARTNPKLAEKQINSYLRYLARVNNINKKLIPKVQITDDVENAMGIYTNKGHLIKIRPEFADANIISHEYFHNTRALILTQARLQVPDAQAQAKLNCTSNYKAELINAIADQIGTEGQMFNLFSGVHQRPNFSTAMVPKIRQLVRDSLDTYEFNPQDKSFNLNARKYNDILDKFINELTKDEIGCLLKNLNPQATDGNPRVAARILLDDYLTVERGRFYTLDSNMQIYPGDKSIYDPVNKKFMDALLAKPFNNRCIVIFRQSVRYHAESINVPKLHTLSPESDIARQFSLLEEIRARNHGYSKKLSGLLKENPELETSLKELSSEVPRFEENFPGLLKGIKEQVNVPGSNPEATKAQNILKQIENPKIQEAIKLKALMKYNSQLYQAQNLIHKFKEINFNESLTPTQRDSIKLSLMNRIKDSANKAQKYRWSTKDNYGQYIDEGIAFNEILEFLVDPANRITSTILNPQTSPIQPNGKMAYRFTPDNDANLPNVKDFSLNTHEEPLLTKVDPPLNTIEEIEQALKEHSEISGLIDEYIHAGKFEDAVPGPLGDVPKVLLGSPEPSIYLEEVNARLGHVRMCQNYIQNCDNQTLGILIKDLRKSIDGTWRLYLNKRERFLESKFLNKKGTEKLEQAVDNALELHNRLVQIGDMVERFRGINIYQYHADSIPELTEAIRQKALGKSYDNPINEYLKKVNEFCTPFQTGTYTHNIQNEGFVKISKTYTNGKAKNTVASQEIPGNKWVIREVSETPVKDFPPKPTNIYRLNAAPSEELITAMDQFIIKHGGTYRVASGKETWLTNHDTVIYYPHFKLSLEAEIELAKITSKFARPSGTSFGGEKVTDGFGNEINPWLKKDCLPAFLQQFQLVQRAYNLDPALGEALNLKWLQTNGFGPVEFRALEDYLTGLENNGLSISQFSLRSPAPFLRKGMPNIQPTLNPETVNSRNHAIAERQLKSYLEYLAKRSGRNPKLNPKAEIVDSVSELEYGDAGAYIKNQNKIVSNTLWYEVLAHEDKHFEFAYHLTHLRLQAPEEFKKALIKHMISSFENRSTMIDFDSLESMRRLHFPAKVSSKVKGLLNDCLELFNLPKDKAEPTINTSKVIEKIEGFTNGLTIDERDILLLHFSRIESIDQIISNIAKKHNVKGVNCFLDVFRSKPDIQNIFISDLINAHITLELKRFTGFCVYGLPCPNGLPMFHPGNKNYLEKCLNNPYSKGDYVTGDKAIGQLIEIYDVPSVLHKDMNKNLIVTQTHWNNYYLLYDEIYARIKGYSEEAKGILKTNPQLEKVINNTKIQNGQSEAFLNTLQDIKGGTDFIKAVTKIKYNSRLFRAKFLKEEIIKASKSTEGQNKIPTLIAALQEAVDEAEQCRWPYKISATEYSGEGLALNDIKRFLQRLVTSK